MQQINEDKLPLPETEQLFTMYVTSPRFWP